MLASRLTFVLALSAAACAVAQPASPPADPAQVPTAVARMLGAYRFGAIAERVSLTATDAQHQVTSDVTLRVDAGDPRTQRPRRLRLEMGRLVIYAQDDRLVAVHTQNDEQFSEVSLPRHSRPLCRKFPCRSSASPSIRARPKSSQSSPRCKSPAQAS
jgi:hypothetical protein